MIRCDRAAVMIREFAGRVIDISASGCLIDSCQRLKVGTVGRLRLRFGTDECADDVEVVRCAAIDGRRHFFHVGVRFVSTLPPEFGSIRHVMAEYVADWDSAETMWVM